MSESLEMNDVPKPEETNGEMNDESEILPTYEESTQSQKRHWIHVLVIYFSLFVLLPFTDTYGYVFFVFGCGIVFCAHALYKNIRDIIEIAKQFPTAHPRVYVNRCLLSAAYSSIFVCCMVQLYQFLHSEAFLSADNIDDIYSSMCMALFCILVCIFV